LFGGVFRRSVDEEEVSKLRTALCDIVQENSIVFSAETDCQESSSKVRILT
jgi:hypothetical protein